MLFQPMPPEWERAEHFEYYQTVVRTRYNLNAEVDITETWNKRKTLGLKFYPVFLWMVMNTVNRWKEMRMTTDADGAPGYWTYCSPVYPVFHEDDHTFSDLWTEWKPDFAAFYRDVVHDMQTYGDVHGVKGKDNQPINFTPVSMAPWISFTGHGSDTFTAPQMLFPIFVGGRCFERDGRVWLPLSVSCNHAAADGWHASQVLLEIEQTARHPERWMTGV
ncbi:MAG: CatA-like O-acetyltransferase [Butyricicoccus sp.]